MLTGRCGCGAVTYRMASKPMLVHCCCCSECQTQTGSAFAINAIIEADRVTCEGPVTEHHLPTPSGKGQITTRCATCGVAVFSNYLVREGKLRYIRVGTLDDPSECPPDVQIFTSSLPNWAMLDPSVPSYEKFYDFKDVWPEPAWARWQALFGA